jgi:phage-related minor tail protein
MGEAGPEAILPLTRIGGDLGVRTTGGGGPSNVNINFTVNTMDARDFDSLLVEKKQLITNIVSSAVRQGRRGSSYAPQSQTTSGGTRGIIGSQY